MAPATLRPEGPPNTFNIRRKPVSNPNLRQTANAQAPGPLLHAATSPALVPPERSPPPSYSDLYGGTSPGYLAPANTLTRPRTAEETSTSSPPKQSANSVQKAYGEARHFLGGLITHPAESNKHVTILRHSHGLVFYRGNTTSVAVSIFSDTPLPQDRTLWLQSRGWTGNTGMRAKALFHLRDSWIDVTPGMPLSAAQINPTDERAWQRDIKKFYKKAPPRPREKHLIRETAVVRIPAEAGDGYFQLVLCAGQKKKVLGNSPVFRVLSTSASPSSLRGASLSTLPLELGAMIASLYAQTAAQAVASPVATAVKGKVDPYRPSWLTQTAATTVYSASGAQDKVASVTSGIGSSRGRVAGSEETQTVMGNLTPVDLGPQPPFPMVFKARGELIPPDSDSSTFGQMVRLGSVPDWVPQRLRGYFFGWARSDDSKESTSWCPVILSIRAIDPLQAARVDMSQLAKLTVKLRLLEDTTLQTKNLEIRVMGFLRSEIPPPTGKTREELAAAQATAAEAAMLADAYDESIVQTTLGHIAWAPDLQSQVEAPKSTGWVDRTKEGYANMQTRGQKWVEKVPLHRLGVRSATDQMRESQIAVNGFYIVR